MIQFLKTKGIAILGVFMVMSMFLFANVGTVYALNNSTSLEEDVVKGIPCTTDYYYLKFSDGTSITPNDLISSDRTITLENVSDTVFELYGQTNANPRLLRIEPNSTYILDSNFWNELSVANYSKDNGLYLTCTANKGSLTDVSLKVTLSKTLSPFQKVLKFVVSIGESLFALAGSTITFIVEHPIALFGLLIGLIYTGILIFRLITKGV